MAQATDPIEGFFAGLAAAGHLASLEGGSESIRFDIDTADDQGTDHWHVEVRDGDVTVARGLQDADAVIRIARPDLAAVVTGGLNAQAAIIRGLLTCTGSMAAFIMFQRCLPGPPGSAGRARPISSRDMMARHDLGRVSAA